MKQRKKVLIIFLLLVFGIPLIISAQQQVIDATGGEGTASGVILQWSLGECITVTSDVQSGVQLTQGFQQPTYEVQTLIEETDLTFSLEVFPIPASDFLTVKSEANNLQDLQATLYNMNGSAVIRYNLNNSDNCIDMQAFPAAQYILTITDTSGKLLKSFKIVKQ